MKFIDSNIIAYAFYDNKYVEECQKVLQEEGLTDTFCLVEAFFIIEKETDKERAIESIKGVLKSQIRIIDVTTNSVFESIKNIKKVNLSLFDCIHYTTAKLNACSEIISYDRDFNKLDIPRKEP